ncbi:MAG TPA: 2-nitropropane dioxygenase, partial [Paenisporosarcina sp.]|nr:2-nitropropane dioxygenase [Paenisporosarcina sp.]
TEKQHVKGAIEGDMENGFINSGQIAGLIDHIPSVKELFESMIQVASNQINLSRNELDIIIEKRSKNK